jgi:hypothetical protein
MSQQRRGRKSPEEGVQGDRVFLRKVIISVVIVAVCAGVYYFGYHRHAHKYDAFARCLSDKGVKMYGAWWCPHCQEQKAMFDAAFKYAPYVECGLPKDTSKAQPVCTDAGIKHFPTWQFPPVGDRVEGVVPLEDLSLRTGCPLQ